MKNFLLSTFTAILLLGCNTYQNPDPYSYIQSPTGQQMVVVHDNSGAQFVMEYMLFNSLMNSGGYGSVINYYHVHPTMFRSYDRNYYSSWKPYRGTYSGYTSGNHRSGSYSTSSPQFRNTSPAPKTSVFRNTTPISKPSTSFRSTSPSSSSFRSTGSSYRSSSSSYRSSSFRSTGRH
jgi:hypothetical protein